MRGNRIAIGSGGASDSGLLSPNQPAAGQINPDGTYVLSTVQPDDGATPGKYTVSVVTDLKVRGRQLHVMCSGPAQLLLEVEADKENTIDIDIRQNSGWKLAADD